MPYVDKFLSRLKGVRKLGDGRYVAHCPAHDDRTPSLHATVKDGRLLIHCKAECTAQDVLDSIGLTFADLYPDADRAAYAAATASRGKKWSRNYPVDELALERRILEIARHQINQGKELSLEDQVRLEIAIERVKHG